MVRKCPEVAVENSLHVRPVAAHRLKHTLRSEVAELIEGHGVEGPGDFPICRQIFATSSTRRPSVTLDAGLPGSLVVRT